MALPRFSAPPNGLSHDLPFPAEPIQVQLGRVEDSIQFLSQRIDNLSNILLAGFMSIIVTLVVGLFFN